ncbi:MAG: amidohydrolase [Proteobacteria bacterium]|nr:amidohydrolase [Pseudomonadota bacterium]
MTGPRSRACRVWLWTGLLALAPAAVLGAPDRPAAELVVEHARVWTVDALRPEVQAFAVSGGRIIAVGSDREIDLWRGPTTRYLDAGGRRVMPGFNDAHVHFSDGGEALAAVQLNDATSSAEFVRRIAEYARRIPPGQWIRHGNWDETKWTPAVLPTRELIDAVTPDNPVAIDRYDGHLVLLNSKALALAGITAATPDPPGGVIVRDAHGAPTGALKDAAQALVERVIPAPTPAERRAALERAFREAASLGVTSVQDMANPPLDYGDLAALAQLVDEGRTTARVYLAPLISGVDDQAKLGVRRAFGGPWLRIGAVKGYADGSLGSATAYFFEPFVDQPENRGLLSDAMQPLARMRAYLARADETGLQVCIHAIGDAAISTVLDLYGEVVAAGGPRDRRWRIEHAQHMAARDFERFAALGVIASVQPYHAIDDGRWAEARIGHDRAARTYAFRSFRDHGVRLAFGTDWPVAPLDPMATLYAATTRATLDGRHPEGWFPEQKLSIQEAIEAYTLGSAYAEFQEHEKGSITPGKLADFVLLSEDALAVPAADLRRVRVLRTFVGGVEVYRDARVH